MKISRRCMLSFILTIIFVLVLPAQSLNSLHPQVKRKIDPLLQNAISVKERFPSRPMLSVESYAPGARLSTAAGDVVAVLIQSPTDVRDYVQVPLEAR